MKIVRRAVATLLVCAAATVVGSSLAAADPGDAAGAGAAVPVPEGVTASFAVYDREPVSYTHLTLPTTPYV